jgi:FKBP-type peptidyl-prolyl cis-trans isomerase
MKTGPAATKTTKPGASKTATAKTATALTLNTDKDKQSYAIGINVGKGLSQNLKQAGVEIDPAILTRAIKDVLSGGKQSMTDQEAQETLKALQTEMRAEQAEKTKQLAEANKKEGDEFLAANKAKEGVTTLPDGLQYKILQEGTGPKPSATDAVTVNYRGALVNGTEFDSSYKRGQPATFNVTGIIKGWTEALQLMPVGSKWQLVIPSDLAYGPSGRPPVIGPNSTLVFEVELVSIQPKPAAPAPAAAPASNPGPAAASPNAAPAPNAPPPPKPTPPAPKADPAPAPTPKPPTP